MIHLKCDNCGHSVDFRKHQHWNNDPPEYETHPIRKTYGLYKSRSAVKNNCLECGCEQLSVRTKGG